MPPALHSETCRAHFLCTSAAAPQHIRATLMGDRASRRMHSDVAQRCRLRGPDIGVENSGALKDFGLLQDQCEDAGQRGSPKRRHRRDWTKISVAPGCPRKLYDKAGRASRKDGPGGCTTGRRVEGRRKERGSK